jgi:glycosyltransferase involved in cell wall biosynthesis
MATPKFTVIIPTRERDDVLGACLKTVTAQDYDNLEIIVSDNVSGDETREIVQAARDPRIRYINPGRRLSMSHHWEFALSHVSGGWVGFIGDDDGLLPDALTNLAAVIAETGVLAVRSSICNYSWPGISRQDCGRLSVPLKTGVEIRSGRQWTSKLLNGDAWYTDLPMIYQSGYVDYSVVESIKKRSRIMFRSCIPDVYSGLAISQIIPKYAYVKRPAAINGASRHSHGRSFLRSARNDASSPSAKFNSEGNIPFHKDLPLVQPHEYPKSVSMLIYEAYLQSEVLHEAPVERMHAKQLRLALATSVSSEAIEEWARLFARRYGLDFNVLLSQSNRDRIWFDLRNLLNLAWEELSTARIGSQKLPLLDVFQASLAAAQILLDRPSAFRNFARATGRAVEKAVERLRGNDPSDK